MSVTALNNLGLHVADLERSLAFYVGMLGLEVGHRSPILGPGPITAVSGTPGATLRIAALRLPGTDISLALVTLEGVQRAAVAPAFEDAGATHLSLQVDDLDRLLEQLAERGHPALGPVAELHDGPRPARIAFVRDPDGFFVELVEALEV